jgi:nitroimidazol reductase NimA-like FMN-containing flavoprotein (pyridoxamine 5'-phosphate oxidase superfamily)
MGSGRAEVRSWTAMRETPADLQRLQVLIDDSIERATAFLRSSFEMPGHSLSAAQLAAHLQGALTVSLATVTARGEPRVAPINAVFLRGQFYLPTVAEAARARHLARRPGASLAYYEGTSLAVIAHGSAAIIDADHVEFAEIDSVQTNYGQSPREWHGSGVYLLFKPATLYTFAQEPDRYLPTAT